MCNIINAYVQEAFFGDQIGHATIKNCRSAGLRRFSWPLGPFDDHADFWRLVRSAQRAEHSKLID